LRSAKRTFAALGALALLVLLAAAAAPALVRAHWSSRSANPVRRGVRLARDLGCFSCHGPLGTGGVGDPTATIGEVPAWSGGTWMMYVNSDEQIRQFILDGVSQARRESATGAAERERLTIAMPSYRGLLDESELDDLVAAFKVLSRMTLPPEGSPARRGLALVERWDCASCHGPAGSGGLPNPGSLTGFVPGWYGAEFEDLVRDQTEFEAWVREGRAPRLAASRIASYFMRRQRLSMPAYRGFEPEELDDLWAYARWLEKTQGGHAVP
jgi:mono/diheme cytochrome c family protein